MQRTSGKKRLHLRDIGYLHEVHDGADDHVGLDEGPQHPGDSSGGLASLDRRKNRISPNNAKICLANSVLLVPDLIQVEEGVQVSGSRVDPEEVDGHPDVWTGEHEEEGVDEEEVDALHVVEVCPADALNIVIQRDLSIPELGIFRVGIHLQKILL